jgi:hypothetical protein
MPIGDFKYKVRCIACDKQFIVDTAISKVPKHPPQGVIVTPGTPYIPCIGSGQMGVPIGPHIVGT